MVVSKSTYGERIAMANSNNVNELLQAISLQKFVCELLFLTRNCFNVRLKLMRRSFSLTRMNF